MIAPVFSRRTVSPAVEEAAGSAMRFFATHFDKQMKRFPVANDNRRSAPARVARARAVEAMAKEGMSHNQIAKELDISRGNVASLASLAKKLNEENEE